MDKVGQSVGKGECIQEVLKCRNKEEFRRDIKHRALWLHRGGNDPSDRKEKDDGGYPASNGQRDLGGPFVTRPHDDFSAHTDSSAFFRALRT